MDNNTNKQLKHILNETAFYKTVAFLILDNRHVTYYIYFTNHKIVSFFYNGSDFFLFTDLIMYLKK